MFCPDCGNEIPQNDNFCKNCGCNINNEDFRVHSFNPSGLLCVLFFILIVAAITYNYLAKVGSSINLDDSNVPEVILKPDKCTSPYVENEVISLFKEQDLYFKDIDFKTIDSIMLQSKETVSNDEKAAKYICSGIIEIKSSPKGFRPIDYNNNNAFYNKIYIDYDENLIAKYTTYAIPIFYTSQIIENKNKVEINEFGNGEFNCKGICEPIHRFAKQTKKIPLVLSNDDIQPKIKQNIPNIVNVNDIKHQNNDKIKKDKKKKLFKIFKRKKREKI